MVTAGFARSAAFLALTLGSLLIGLYVQDQVKHSREERINRRVKEEVERRLLLRQQSPEQSPAQQQRQV